VQNIFPSSAGAVLMVTCGIFVIQVNGASLDEDAVQDIGRTKGGHK